MDGIYFKYRYKSINLNYYIEDNSKQDTEYQRKTVQITKEELESVLNEMKKGKITKVYYGAMYHPCIGGIDINYTGLDNKDYKLNLYMYKYINVTEAEQKKFLELLEETEHTVEK